MSRKPLNFRFAALLSGAAVLLCLLSSMSLAVEFANIDIADGVDPINDAPIVSIPAGQGTAGFGIGAGVPITGLFPVSFSGDPTTDSANGVLLGYVRETGRVEPDSLGGTETLYATAANSRRPDDSYSLVVRRAGFKNPAGPSLYEEHAAFNANVAAAYFPFSEGWLAGAVYNAENNGPLVEMVASPGITLIDHFQQDLFGTGDHLLKLPGVTDSRRQGLLFVNGAKNEGNYALSEPTAGGSGFTITGHDNASSGSAGEVDPVSFVFMPLGTPNVTMARIFARGHGPTQDPVAMIKSGDNFTISRENQGEYRLSIPGQTPTSGTLLVSPSGANDGNNGNNSDNIVTYKADGNDWIILAQDLSDTVELHGVGQESGDRAESYFSFAFMPFNTPVTAPGLIPSVSSLTTFSKSRIIGWNADVTQVTDGNSPGNMYISEPEQTANLNVVSLFENKGDNVFAVDGAFLGKSDGVMFATVSEGLRDNSLVGGQTDYGVVGVSQTNDSEWWVHTGTADSAINDEFNVDFSVAFFGADTGFELGQRVPTSEVAGFEGTLDVTIAGVNSLTDGVLLTNSNARNQTNFVTADPRDDGSGWDLINNDNDTTGEGEEVNYVYLPFDAENLVAGRVDADGTIAASTDTDDFSLTKTADGTYVLTVNGKTPSDGMLLLTSTGEGDSSDNSLVYETALNGTDFNILGIDLIAAGEGGFVDLEDTSFMFAYIDFDLPPALAAAAHGDFDNDGDVDGADFLLWQRGGSPNGATAADLAVWESDYGTPPGSFATSTVPEPGSILLLGLAIAAGNLLGFVPVSRSFNRN